MGIETAIIAGISAVGSIAGGMMQADAAESAANTQAAAARDAAALQQARYEQTRHDLSPYRDLGAGAVNLLTNRIEGLTAPIRMDQATLEATPGYQFTLGQGLKTVQNSAAARGLGVSGAAMKGAAEYATGLANKTWGDQFNAENTNRTNAFNRLYQVAALGENAGAQTGNLGQQAATNQGNLITGGANATAAGQVGSANAIAGGINSIGGNAMNYLMMNKLLGGSSGGATGNEMFYRPPGSADVA